MKRRLCTISLTAALVLAGCSGGEAAEQADAPNDVTATNAARSVGSAGDVTTTTTAAPQATTTTTTTIAPLAPNTLAFASAADVGRLFTLDIDITAATTAGGEPDAATSLGGTVVQASRAATVDGVLWVRIESTDGERSTLGWVPADVLSPTTESVFSEDPTSNREFRQVASAVAGDQLQVLSNPASGAGVAALSENEISMHGGVSALAPDGSTWVDVIDPASGSRVGWVPGQSFTPLRSGAIQDGVGARASTSPIAGVSYGQSLVAQPIVNGCNAIQVTFVNSSTSAGLGLVFGSTSPVGRELSADRFQWSGTSAFSGAGADITITIPTSDAQTWFFAPLDADRQAESSGTNEDGLAIASDVQQIAAPASSCVPEAPITDENILYQGDEAGALAAAAEAAANAEDGDGATEDGEGATVDGTPEDDAADGDAEATPAETEAAGEAVSEPDAG